MRGVGGQVGVGGERGGGGRVWRSSVPVMLFAVFVAVLCCAFMPAGASAEPLCTDTWVGPAEGAWLTASDWSTGKVPSSSDVACIEAGKTVAVAEGSGQAGVLLDKGTVVVSFGGSLELASSLEPSSAKALTVNEGTLTGPATVDITGLLAWERGGVMSGSGSTVLQLGASATIGNAKLVGRTLVNEATVTLSGTLTESEGAQVRNASLFQVSSAVTSVLAEGTGAVSRFINTGALSKTAGKEPADVEVNFEGTGTINGQAGPIAFPSSKTVSLGASVLEGEVFFDGAAATVTNLNASAAHVTVSGGSLSVGSGSTATMGVLLLDEEGVLGGAGEFYIGGSLNWEQKRSFGPPMMSGAGSTVIPPGVSARVGNAKITERKLVNEGTTTIAFGDLKMTWPAPRVRVDR